MSAPLFWLPEHQHHLLYTAAHVDGAIDQLSRILETYLRPPGPLNLRSRYTLANEEVVLVGVDPLPEAVPRLFADALNQMRNMLEHALTAEVEVRLRRGLTPDEARAVEVPATASEDAFGAWTRHKHRKSHGLFARGTDLGERLARVQPWNRKESDLHPLRRLVSHTNAAKHQAPAVMTVRVGKVQLDSAPRDVEEIGVGDVGAVIASVPRGTREGVSVWPQVAVRRPHTGELRTLMWEVREVEEWVRRIALPIFIVGRADMPELPPHLDISRGYGSTQQAWESAGPVSAALRANERMMATALRTDIAEMMVAEDGESTRDAYVRWLATLENAHIVAMFEPLGTAAKEHDFEKMIRITEQWRDAAGIVK